MNNVETKKRLFDVNKLKNIPVHFKNLSDIGSKKDIKNTKFKKLHTKVNNVESKIPDVSTLIQTNLYNTDKESLEKKLEMLLKQYCWSSKNCWNSE